MQFRGKLLRVGLHQLLGRRDLQLPQCLNRSTANAVNIEERNELMFRPLVGADTQTYYSGFRRSFSDSIAVVHYSASSKTLSMNPVIRSPYSSGSSRTIKPCGP